MIVISEAFRITCVTIFLEKYRPETPFAAVITAMAANISSGNARIDAVFFATFKIFPLPIMITPFPFFFRADGRLPAFNLCLLLP